MWDYKVIGIWGLGIGKLKKWKIVGSGDKVIVRLRGGGLKELGNGELGLLVGDNYNMEYNR